MAEASSEATAAGEAATEDVGTGPRGRGIAARARSGDELIHEGWCVKESGTKFCGRYQWQKRWFRLVTDRHGKSQLGYYKGCTDDPTQMAGSVTLDTSYCTRPVEKQHGKVQPYCFAVGPLVEDGVKRTYYISCASEQIRQEWMEVLDAVIEGVPEDAKRRRASIFQKMATGEMEMEGDETSADISERVDRSYGEPKARLKEWVELHRVANDPKIWKKSDTKSGIKVSRAQFGDRNSCDQIKIEGVVNASVDLLYTFLQQASQAGGKLDYPFRQEEVLEEFEDEPAGHVFFNQYSVPWPRISQRDICCTCAWVPQSISPPEVEPSCGVVLYSVEHSTKPRRKEVFRVRLDASGIFLKHHPTESGEVVTYMTAVIQINTLTSLQRMLRGAYRSGLLKLGLRSGFEHIVEQVENYQRIISGY